MATGSWTGTTPRGVYKPAMNEKEGNATTGAWKDFDTSLANIHNKLWRDNVVNVVSDYEADPTGATDSTTAIQAAATAVSTGGGLYFPYGTYLINTAAGTALTSKSNIKISGDKATIKMHGSATDGWRFFTFTDCTDIEIHGLNFDRNSNDRYGGLMFYNSQRIWIHHNKFIDSDKQAVATYDRYAIVFGFGTGQSSDIFIHDNYLQYQEIEVDYAKNVHIYHNTIDQAILAAAIAVISIDDSYSAENYYIHDNIITDPYKAGVAVVVDVAGKTGNTFRNIHIRNNLITKLTNNYSFISFGGAGTNAANTFEDCSIIKNKLYIDDSATGVWSQDPGLIGFSLAGTPVPYFDRFVIDGNEIYGSSQTARGIWSRRMRDGVVANNKVYEMRYGIKFDTNTRCQMHNNVVKADSGTATSAYEFYASGGNNSIHDNKILGTWTNKWDISAPASTDQFLDYSVEQTGTTPALSPYGSTELNSSSNAIDATLGDGEYIGQIKTIVMTNATNASTVTVAHHNLSDGEVFDFKAVDAVLVLLWTGTEWITLKEEDVGRTWA